MLIAMILIARLIPQLRSGRGSDGERAAPEIMLRGDIMKTVRKKTYSFVCIDIYYKIYNFKEILLLHVFQPYIY